MNTNPREVEHLDYLCVNVLCNQDSCSYDFRGVSEATGHLFLFKHLRLHWGATCLRPNLRHVQ
jgi:hypothetical protein